MANKISYVLKGEELLKDDNPESRLKAYMAFKKAERRGEYGARYWLGICKHHGIGTSWSKDKALEWFLKGAEEGDARCMLQASNILWERRENEADRAESVRLLKMAAGKELCDAQYLYGIHLIYEDGAVEEGILYIARSAAGGDDEGLDEIKRLERTCRLVGRDGKEGRPLTDSERLALARGEALLGMTYELFVEWEDVESDAQLWYETAADKEYGYARELDYNRDILNRSREEADFLENLAEDLKTAQDGAARRARVLRIRGDLLETLKRAEWAAEDVRFDLLDGDEPGDSKWRYDYYCHELESQTKWAEYVERDERKKGGFQ